MSFRTDQIQTRYEKIRSSLHCNVTDEDYKRIDQKLKQLSELARIENRSISVFDVNRNEFILKVDRHMELLGYDGTEEINVNNYHKMIHTDDLPFLYDSEIKMFEFLKPVRSDEKKNYKLIYDYRVRKKGGSYIRFLHQLLLYELDRNYNSWLLLILSDVISAYPEDAKPRRFLMNTKTKEICLFDEETGIKRFLITEREKEILELISQGFDSQEIADKLFVSLNTVNNHRQHVLQKTSTKNITQAITYLKLTGIM
jgi:DNA-binding CsgD family transcriptional regulator